MLHAGQAGRVAALLELVIELKHLLTELLDGWREVDLLVRLRTGGAEELCEQAASG
jgi:hypothetical protein